MRHQEILLPTIVERALTDTQARQGSLALFRRATYPSRSELAEFGLTELNFLALQLSEPANRSVPKGVIYSLPGGAAANLAVAILQADLSVRQDRLAPQGASSAINVFLMIHGAIAPNPPLEWDFWTPMNRPLEPPTILSEQCELYKQGYHAHNMSARGNFFLGHQWYEKLSCGGGGEVTLDTREQAQETYQQLRIWAEERHIGVRFFIVEAIAPLTGVPRIRLFSDHYSASWIAGKVDSLDQFLHQGDNFRTSLEGDYSAQFSCRDYPIERIISLSALNDVLRDLMDRGEDIVGIGCSDARQGLCICDTPHQEADTVSAPNIPAPRYTDLRRENLAGHSEPVGLIMIGASTQRIGYYLVSRRFWVLRSERHIFPRILSRAWPFLINVPYSIWRTNAALISKSLEQLVCVIDENYRRGLNPFFRAPQVYMVEHDKTYEIVSSRGRSLDGLQFIYPGELDNIISHIRPGYPAFRLNFEIWGMSSHHIRSHYARRSVDTFEYSGHAGMKSGATYATVLNQPLRTFAKPQVGIVWPFGRRRLGVRVPIDSKSTLNADTV